jgi:hypothetical protein
MFTLMSGSLFLAVFDACNIICRSLHLQHLLVMGPAAHKPHIALYAYTYSWLLIIPEVNK